MDGPRRQRSFVRSSAPAVILGWFVVGIFRYAHHVTYNFPLHVAPLPVALYYAFDALRWIAFTLLVLWFVQRYPADSMKRWTLWTVIAPLLLVSASVMVATDLLVFSSAAAGPLGVSWPNALLDVVQKRFHRLLLDVTAVVILAYGIGMHRSLAAEELRNARLEAAVTATRLDALRRELHPHLLFNTLNAVTALIRRRPDDAERMLVHLSELLRGVLRAGRRTTIPLREDVAFVQAFLRIHEHSFPHGLRIETDIPPLLLDAAVPPLLLQPLVENSVKHGLPGITGEAVIAIAATSDGSDLVLRVSDPGNGAPGADAAEGFGVGLRQIHERLREMYRTNASVELSSIPGGGTTVTVCLPLRFVEESELLRERESA